MAANLGRPGCGWKWEADEGRGRPSFKNITQPSNDQNQSLFISLNPVQKFRGYCVHNLCWFTPKHKNWEENIHRTLLVCTTMFLELSMFRTERKLCFIMMKWPSSMARGAWTEKRGRAGLVCVLYMDRDGKGDTGGLRRRCQQSCPTGYSTWPLQGREALRDAKVNKGNS